MEKENIERISALSAPRNSSNCTYQHRAFDQFEAMLERRVREHLQPDADAAAPLLVFDPPTPNDDAPYSRFVREHHLDRESQLLRLLAFAPWLRPDCFECILQKK